MPMLSEEEKSKLIQSSWMRFNSNIGALYAFFENLTIAADATDKANVKQFAKELAFIFKDKSETVEKDISKFIPSVDDLDVFPDFRRDDSAKEIISAMQDPDLKQALLEWGDKHPYRSQKFVRAFLSAFNNPPVSGVLIRRSMLVSLVTFWEILFEDLYKNYYLALDKTRNEAEKEASKLMYGNWKEKIANLKKIGLDISVTKKYSLEVFEITQRRNLLVHNDGVVNEKYFSYFPNKYQLGDHLLVSTRYFQRAIDMMHMFGFLLFYKQWAQYEENNQSLYGKLYEFIVNSLNQKRYSLVLELSENSESLELPEDKKHVILVNRAIAFRETNKAEEVNKIVAYLEETKHDWQIEMAISMLKNDIPKLQQQIKQAPKGLVIATISAWPLFDPVRDAVWFKMALMKKDRVQLPKKKRR